MLNDVRLLKALADENRLRLLLLLRERELFVCQLMAVTGLSQPLVSRSLALLERQGLLRSRRQGKHVFYRLNGELPPLAQGVLAALADGGGPGAPFARDRAGLELFCRKFRGAGTCDMALVKRFMAYTGKIKYKEIRHGKTGQKGFR
jgi:ArsR family transcriptional regulator